MKKNVSISAMMIPKLIGVIFLFFSLLYSCTKENVSPDRTAAGGQSESPTPPVDLKRDAQQISNPADLIPPILADADIYVAHGSCMGRCPVYSVAIKNNGTVRFTGSWFVATEGTVTFRVNPIIIDRLRENMLNNGFLFFEPYYPLVVDVPQNITALRYGTGLSVPNSKVVVDYGKDVPEALVAMRNLIEHSLGIDKLVYGSPTPSAVSPVSE